MNRWKEEYLKNGYIIVDILSDVQSLGFRKILENEVLGLDKRDLIVDPTVKLLDGYFQKEGHKLDDYGNELKLYYINNVSFLDKCEKIRELYCNEKLMNISEEIIGENLALDGSALLLAETGTHYELAWHRDTIQIPQNEISDKLFTGEYFHNNVQINLALSYDESLWVVPGSHKRPLNKHEQEVFGMSKHYALDNCSLPDQYCVKLKPGQAVLYNNNIVHRGYCKSLSEPRRVVHMGYHSTLHPPTWHAYHLNPEIAKKVNLVNYPSDLAKMIENSFRTLERYPEPSKSWKHLGGEYA